MADTYNIKLLPCPFCGSEQWRIFGPHPDMGIYFVECSEDNLEDDDFCGDWYCAAENKQQVAEAWNRRATR